MKEEGKRKLMKEEEGRRWRIAKREMEWEDE